jgi:hypothetical protein
MGEARLAKIVYRVAKMLVSLLEEEYGLGKKDRVAVMVIQRHNEPPL